MSICLRTISASSLMFNLPPTPRFFSSCHCPYHDKDNTTIRKESNPCTNRRRRKMGIKGRRKKKRERRREKSLVVVYTSYPETRPTPDVHDIQLQPCSAQLRHTHILATLVPYSFLDLNPSHHHLHCHVHETATE
ncbi:hypothetical protein VTJ04DRAFT_4769 [Mycothermus thermophilus]|uniref:uncharacterized protein n=1 Tax=Humicola insolens TaxID=85995 RepID=UPI003742D346